MNAPQDRSDGSDPTAAGYRPDGTGSGQGQQAQQGQRYDRPGTDASSAPGGPNLQKPQQPSAAPDPDDRYNRPAQYDQTPQAQPGYGPTGSNPDDRYNRPAQYDQTGQQQPGQYGTGPSGPGQYGQNPYNQGQYGQGQQPGSGGPPYGDREGFSYTPYGSSYPAGLGADDTAPVTRPGTMVLALILLILAALPFLVGGLVVLLVPLEGALPPEILNDPRLIEAGGTPELIIGLIRTLGVILLILAALYVLFAVLAFTRKNWARILVLFMTIGFVLLLVLGLSGGASDPVSLTLVLAVLAASIAGVVLMFTGAAARWYSAVRR